MTRRLVSMLLAVVVALTSTVVLAPGAQAAPAAVDLVFDLPTPAYAGKVSWSVTAESDGSPAAGSVTVEVRDSSDSVVTGVTGATASPTHGTTWTGDLAAGAYTLSATFEPTDPATHAPALATEALTVALNPVTLDLAADPPAPRHQQAFALTATATSSGKPLLADGPGTIVVQKTAADGVTLETVRSFDVDFTGGVATQPGIALDAGSYVLTATFAHGLASHEPASVAGVPLTVTTVADAIEVPPAPTRPTPGDRWVAPTATSTSGRTVEIAAAPSGVCSVDGPDVKFDGAGACTVTFSTPTSSGWVGASVPVTFDIRKDATIALTVSPATPLHRQELTITAKVTDTATGGPVAYSGPGTITISGEPDRSVTFTNGSATTAKLKLNRGSYTLGASIPAHGDYYPADVSGVPLTVAKGIQVVTPPPAPTDAVVGGLWVAPTATVTPDGSTPVVSAAGACSVSGPDVVYDAPGDCTVTFTALATANLEEASAQVTFPIVRRAVVLSLDVPASRDYGQPVVITATASDTTAGSPDATVPGTFVLTIDGTPVPAVVDPATSTATYTFSPPSSGTYQVEATFTPTSATRYTAPSPQSRALVVTVADQTVAATNTPTPGYTQDIWQMSLTRGGSDNPVLLTSLTPAICTLTGAAVDGSLSLPRSTDSTEVRFVDAGACRIEATQAGVADRYHTADDLIEVTVVKVPVVVTLMVSPDATVGGLVVVKAAARAGGRVGSALYGKAVAGRGPVAIVGGPVVDRDWFGGGELLSFRPEHAVSHTATATFTPADTAVFDSPEPVTRSFPVAKAVQTISIGNPVPSPAYLTQVWDPEATGGGSGNRVLLSVADTSICSVVDVGDPAASPRPQAIELTGTGTCQVSFSQQGNDDYLATALGPVPIVVAKAPVQLTITSSVSPKVGARTIFYASARSGLDGSAVPGTATFEVRGPTDRDDVPARVLDTTVTWPVRASSGRAEVVAEHSGAHQVRVTFTPDSSVPDVAGGTRTESFTIAKGEQTIEFGTPASAEEAVGATWASDAHTNAPGRTVTGEVVATDTGPEDPAAPLQVCSVTGTTVVFERTGLCTVVWSQPGDADWAAAPAVTTEIQVTPDHVDLEVELSVDGGPYVAVNESAEVLVDRQTDPAVAENTVRVRAMGPPLPDSGVTSGLQPAAGQLTLTLRDADGEVATVAGTLDAVDGSYLEFPLPLAAQGAYDLDMAFAPTADWFHARARDTVVLHAARRSQTITPRADVETEALVGEVVRPGFTATSDLPVSYVVPAGTPDAPAACRLTPDLLGVEMLRPEPCVIQVRQGGNHAWAPASSVVHTVLVSRNPTTTTIQAPTDLMVGEATTVRAAAASGGTALAGDFQLKVDGVATGPTVSGTGPEVTIPWTPVSAGDQTVEVAFTPPSGDQKYLDSAGSASVTVAPAHTRLRLEFSAGTVTARVTASAAAGVPTGTVRFSSGDFVLGEAALVNGVARFEHAFEPTETVTVTAVYSGDAHRSPTTVSSTRGVPTITASETPSGTAHLGWYSAPVTVSFTCTTTTAPLSDGCPAPVELTGDGERQRVFREVVALDGGRASVISAPVSIDQTAPQVRVTGPQRDAWYRGAAPKAGCEASDATSGLASCTLTHTRLSALDRQTVATAVDNAGNRSTYRVRFQVRSTWIAKAPLRNGEFRVRAGSRVKVVATTRGSQPQLMLPRAAGLRPRLPGPPMVAVQIENGVLTWVARYKLPPKFRKGQLVQLGVRDRTSLQIVPVRIR